MKPPPCVVDRRAGGCLTRPLEARVAVSWQRQRHKRPNKLPRKRDSRFSGRNSTSCELSLSSYAVNHKSKIMVASNIFRFQQRKAAEVNSLGIWYTRALRPVFLVKLPAAVILQIDIFGFPLGHHQSHQLLCCKKLTLALASSAFFVSRHAMSTLAPLLAKSRTVSYPTPVLHPVMTAVFPSSLTSLSTYPFTIFVLAAKTARVNQVHATDLSTAIINCRKIWSSNFKSSISAKAIRQYFVVHHQSIEGTKHRLHAGLCLTISGATEEC